MEGYDLEAILATAKEAVLAAGSRLLPPTGRHVEPLLPADPRVPTGRHVVTAGRHTLRDLTSSSWADIINPDFTVWGLILPAVSSTAQPRTLCLCVPGTQRGSG
eukprot:867529-Prorocentrum_minimum.AAC.1